MTVPSEDPSPRAQAVIRTVRTVFSLVFIAFAGVIVYLVYLLIRG